MSEFKTRSGVQPNTKKLPYSLSTKEVEKYIQQKLDTLCAKDKSLPNHIEVNIYSANMGVRYVPFIVLLPTSVLEKKSSQKYDNVNPLFAPENGDRRTGKIIPQIYRLFNSYAYNDKDYYAFDSNEWRRLTGVDRKDSAIIKSMTTPKIEVYGSGRDRVEAVTFLIDPIRVFHDMLSMPEDPRDFKVNVSKFQKIKTGEFLYHIEREIDRKNKKNNSKDVIALAMQKRIQH